MSDNDVQVDTAIEQENNGGEQSTEKTESTNEKVFTQDQVNAIVAERVARTKERFSDYDALKTQVADIDTRIEDAKREAAEASKNALLAEVNVERVQSLISYEAKGQFADPSDALLHLKERTDEFVNEDGTVNSEAVTAAIAGLLEQKPHLAAKTNSTGPALSAVGLGQTGTSTPPASNAQKFSAFMQEAMGNN